MVSWARWFKLLLPSTNLKVITPHSILSNLLLLSPNLCLAKPRLITVIVPSSAVRRNIYHFLGLSKGIMDALTWWFKLLLPYTTVELLTPPSIVTDLFLVSCLVLASKMSRRATLATDVIVSSFAVRRDIHHCLGLSKGIMGAWSRWFNLLLPSTTLEVITPPSIVSDVFILSKSLSREAHNCYCDSSKFCCKEGHPSLLRAIKGHHGCMGQVV